ncbi:MAG: hypothetical protein MUF71_07125 [Candidatus Kapabacteria bacterium]|jgi:hypothetical protein|nr:hypothetical protein [Candidatus Kapabacteria bacterium]
MHIHATFTALPEFLSAETSVFMRSLIDSLASSTLIPRQTSAKVETLPEAVTALQALYGAFASSIEPLQYRSAALRGRMESWGVWEQFSPAALPITPERALQTICGIAHTYPEVREALEKGVVPENIVFRSAWKFFLWRWAHRAVFEGDIAVQRFEEDIPATFAQALALKPLRKYDDEFPNVQPLTLKGRFFGGTFEKYVELQHEIERLRSEAMLEAYSLKQVIVRCAEERVREGQMAAVSGLWECSIEQCLE